MRRDALYFERPEHLAATKPAPERGLSRDSIRLMVSSPNGHQHTEFRNLANYFCAGDVLVVNRSATLAASLPAYGSVGEFTLNLSTNYGQGLWLTEPRWSASQPGPLPLQKGETIQVCTIHGRLLTPYPNLERLWFIQFDSELRETIESLGQPIRYAYVDETYSLEHYQTVFSQVAGSAEMPSAAYPFTQNVVDGLLTKGVQIADITLHTGVSSLEVDVEDIENHTLYPEPFVIPQETAEIVNAAKQDGQRIIALGTTVVRALESGWDGQEVKPVSGFTRLYIHPKVGVNVVDGLITGLHDPVTSHLAMLYTIAGQQLIQDAYSEAVKHSYLWHEFGDSHLILTR